MEIAQATFCRSVSRAGEAPRDGLPQVAVAGRSNVGKSSLINWMLRETLARVAKQPGRTTALNFFLVNRRFYLVDLPGYGYARVPQQLRAQWGRELRRYLLEGEGLCAVMCLVDVRLGLGPLDLELQELLRVAGRTPIVVLTKADKVKRGPRTAMRQAVQRQLGLPRTPPAVSVRTGEGRREVLAQVRDVVVEWTGRQRRDD